MCIVYTFKRAGMPIIRNFLHQTEGLLGFPLVNSVESQNQSAKTWKSISKWELSQVVKKHLESVKSKIILDIDDIVGGFNCKVRITTNKRAMLNKPRIILEIIRINENSHKEILFVKEILMEC